VIAPAFIPVDLAQYIENDIVYKPYQYPVFGVRITSLIRTEEPHYFFQSILNYLSNPQSLNSVGLFRVSGNKSDIEYYKQIFNEGKPVTFKCSPFEVAGLVKEYLRCLPEPLIPAFWNSQIPSILAEHKQSDRNPEKLLEDFKIVINSLPKPNYRVFRILVILFSLVVNSAEYNMMNVDNLIKCIAPNLGCYPAIFLHTISNVNFFFGEPLEKKKTNSIKFFQISIIS